MASPHQACSAEDSAPTSSPAVQQDLPPKIEYDFVEEPSQDVVTESPLQLVACEFSCAGCTEKVLRKDLARHMEENMQKHLLNMSLLNLSLTRELHKKMDEKDRQIAELQQQLQQLDEKVDEKFQQLDGRVVEHLQDQLMVSSHTREFTVTNFSEWEKTLNGENWFSDPFHYSFMQGYKFKLNLDFRYRTQMGVYLYLLPSEHDEGLLWPITCTVSIQILDQEEDCNHIERSERWQWYRTTTPILKEICRIDYSSLSTQTHLKGDRLCCKLRIAVKSLYS